MRVRLALPLAAALALAAPVWAQDAPPPAAAKPAKAAAKKPAKAGGDRKPGELEGWTGGGGGALPTPKTATGPSRPPGVLSEKAAPDGGLPLPRERGADTRAPIGFDQNGNMGGMFKF